MFKIGICDDNQTLLNKYQKMVSVVLDKHSFKAEVLTFSDGEDVLKYLREKDDNLDVLFLDILMNKINGVDTAKEIKKMNAKVIIIFLTSSEEYIFESIGLNAAAYLMKDQLTKKIFNQALLKALDLAIENKHGILEFDKSGYKYKLAFNDICFIKIYNGYCYIHHWNGIIFESSDMSLIEKLMGNGFYQVHPQYIVSLQYIGKIEKNHLILSDQSKNKIPVDRKIDGNLKITFANYMINKAKGVFSNEG